MKTIRTMLLAAAAAMMAACGNTGDKTAATETAVELTPRVTVATAVMKTVPQDETYSSTVQANVTNNIAPQSGGRIQKINVEIGDFVSKGQILAEMDKVQLEQTKLSLVNDSTEFVRLSALYKEGAISKSDFEAVELGYKVRKTTYNNLLENTVLRAPVSGVITARNYDRGDMYAMQQPIFVLQQITPVKLLVAISENDYTKVKKGDKVSLTVDAFPGRTFEGRVNRIYPTVNAMTHTVNVEVVVTNSDRALRPGMYAKVKVSFDPRTSVVVPERAVTKQQGSGQRIVYVLDAENNVNVRVVSLGRHLDGEYEILSGLGEGEVVVTKGQAALKGGIKVEVIAD